MTRTRIEWTDDTWNPVTGCTKVSPGCDNCYAEGIANRFAGQKAFPDGFAVSIRPSRIDEPLHWRKPRRVFVNSMSDLFHDAVTRDFLADVFAVMAWSPKHTFQILTKRHGRMRSLLSEARFWVEVGRSACHLGHRYGLDAQALDDRSNIYDLDAWAARRALLNVWLGVSVEDQQRADLRIPALLDTPAAVRFLSCEPLLGPVDLFGPLDENGSRTRPTYWLTGRPGFAEEGKTVGDSDLSLHDLVVGPRIDWVIVGGESGPKARPMHPAWVRQLRDQCAAVDVPFFFKQWGEWAPIDQPGRSVFDYVTDDYRCQIVDIRGQLRGCPWPGWRVQDGTRDAEPIRRYGKKTAGRELDGRTWDQYPAEVPA